MQQPSDPRSTARNPVPPSDLAGLNEPRPPFPKQHQQSPGLESQLEPLPRYQAHAYKAAGKLQGKVALITGGDSGIGRAVAILFAREGASVAINYLAEEESDAQTTRAEVEAHGGCCLLLAADLVETQASRRLVEETVRHFGQLDILVSNAAHQRRKDDLDQLTDEELEYTFATNIYAYIRLARAALHHMKPGSVIIATSSETGIFGSKKLPDYSATKGAINAFTKTLAQSLIPRQIRVNAIAPGPVWTPLNPSDAGLAEEDVATFGEKNPMGRPRSLRNWRRPTCSWPPMRIPPISPGRYFRSWAGKRRAAEVDACKNKDAQRKRPGRLRERGVFSARRFRPNCPPDS